MRRPSHKYCGLWHVRIAVPVPTRLRVGVLYNSCSRIRFGALWGLGFLVWVTRTTRRFATAMRLYFVARKKQTLKK